jgi:hypothetical protein
MNINQKELNIKKLLQSYSIETTPNVYKKYGQNINLVPLDSSHIHHGICQMEN